MSKTPITEPNALAVHPVSGKVTEVAASAVDPITVTLKPGETVAEVVQQLRKSGAHELANVSIFSAGLGHGAVRVASGRLRAAPSLTLSRP
jgi:hypothetical protein